MLLIPVLFCPVLSLPPRAPNPPAQTPCRGLRLSCAMLCLINTNFVSLGGMAGARVEIGEHEEGDVEGVKKVIGAELEMALVGG